MRIRRPILLLLCATMAACATSTDDDWRHLEEYGGSLGTITPLDGAAGIARIAPTPRSGSDDDGMARVSDLLSRMSTGEPRDLDLVTVRRATIDNNLSIQSSLASPLIAEQQFFGERAKFQATFTASIIKSTITNPEFYGVEYIDVEGDSFGVTPGFEVPLRSGGTVQLDWSFGTEASRAAGTPETEVATSQPTLQITQPLLRGAGIEYNEGSIAIAGAQLGMARSQAQLAVTNQLIQAEIAYWQLYLAWKTLRINLDLYETARNLLEEQRRLVDAGTNSIANVYNFEVDVAIAVDRVVSAESSLLQAVRAVKVVMQEPDLSLDSSVALQPTTEPTLVGYEFDSRRLVETAFGNRADLLQYEFQQRSAAVAVMMNENAMLPEIDIMAAWQPMGFTTSVDSGSMADATRNLFEGQAPPGWMVGLNASVSIGNDAAIANHQAAILQRLQIIANRRQREILVTQEVLDAIDTLQAGWSSIVSTEFQVRAAERFYDAYKRLFDRGQIPSSNLSQALQSLSSARVQQATAAVQYQIAKANLAQATGCILGHSGVEWSDDFDRSRLEAADPPNPASGIPGGLRESEGGGGPTFDSLTEPSSGESGPAASDPGATEGP
jgi:outer membrane protein